LLLTLLLTACGRKPGGPQAGVPAGPRAIPVVAAEAKLQAVSESISLVGSVAANEAVELKAETDGLVQEIGFEEGQAVERNHLLVRLDDTRFATALAEAEAGFRLSEATFERSRQLFEDKLVSLQEFDQAAATFERNRATVDRLKRELKDARILAPFAGVVGARHISPGQVISRNTILTTLVDLDPVKLEFYVPERFLSRAQVGHRDHRGGVSGPEVQRRGLFRGAGFGRGHAQGAGEGAAAQPAA
jgi:membrane fusion protein (multidrug efflux system)